MNFFKPSQKRAQTDHVDEPVENPGVRKRVHRNPVEFKLENGAGVKGKRVAHGVSGDKVDQDEHEREHRESHGERGLQSVDGAECLGKLAEIHVGNSR